MTRNLRSRDLGQLRQVTRARELAATAKLAVLASELRQLAEQMDELREKTFDVQTPEDARTLERWSLWRDEELRRLSHCQAQVAAKHRIAAEAAGRMIAENAVLDRLFKLAAKDETETRARRQTHIS